MFLNTQEDFAEFLRKERFERRMSQKELGQMTGLKQQYIYQIENGKMRPRFDTINKILSAFGYCLKIVKKDE